MSGNSFSNFFKYPSEYPSESASQSSIENSSKSSFENLSKPSFEGSFLSAIFLTLLKITRPTSSFFSRSSFRTSDSVQVSFSPASGRRALLTLFEIIFQTSKSPLKNFSARFGNSLRTSSRILPTTISLSGLGPEFKEFLQVSLSCSLQSFRDLLQGLKLLVFFVYGVLKTR